MVDEVADAWLELLGADPRCTVEVIMINTEISTLEARSDRVLWVSEFDGSRWLLNLELQSDHDASLVEAAALRRKNRLLVRSLIVQPWSAAAGNADG